MAPRSLIQDTIEYNRKINSIRRIFKSKKYSQSLLPSKFIRSTQSRSSIEVSVIPINPPCNLPSSIGQDRPRKIKKSLDKYDYVPYTSLDEAWENFETVLLYTQPSNVPQRDLLPKKGQLLNPEPSKLPSARFTLPPEYVDNESHKCAWSCLKEIDDLLDEVNNYYINKRQGKPKLDLSDVDELLESLQEMNVARRYPLPPNFLDEFLSDLKK